MKSPETPPAPPLPEVISSLERLRCSRNDNLEICNNVVARGAKGIRYISIAGWTRLLTHSLCLQQIINELQANWIWVPNWIDSSDANTAGKVVHFTRSVNLSSRPTHSLLHFSADTRYKFYVNGKHVVVGPTRSSPLIWYYDTLDVATYLKEGRNEIHFVVIRYFAVPRSAMPFERTALPGLTVIGKIEAGSDVIDLSSCKDWKAYVDESIQFPMELADDVFLHVRPNRIRAPCFYTNREIRRSASALPQRRKIPPWHHLPIKSKHSMAIFRHGICAHDLYRCLSPRQL